MILAIPYTVLSLAGLLFVWRLLLGPTVSDRVVALDGLLATVMSGVLISAVNQRTAVPITAVVLVALVGFVATAALARYIERRGG